MNVIGIVVHRRSHPKQSPIDPPTAKIKEVEQQKENEGEEDRNREDEESFPEEITFFVESIEEEIWHKLKK